MTYQIIAYHQGIKEKEYEGVESFDAEQAINRIITDNYKHIALEYNGELVVIGYEFVARQLGMVLS